MAYKQAKSYRVFYHPNGKQEGLTDIHVVLSDLSFYRYGSLTPDKAHHLIDLLRNEDMIWIDSSTGIMQVSYEPVGEEETV